MKAEAEAVKVRFYQSRPYGECSRLQHTCEASIRRIKASKVSGKGIGVGRGMAQLPGQISAVLPYTYSTRIAYLKGFELTQ